MTERTYEDFSIADLYREQEETKAAAGMCKDTLTAIEAELAARFGVSVEAKLSGSHGSWNGTLNGYAVKATADKKVKWDSDALLKLALSLPLDQALAIFDIDVKIKERDYANLTGRLRERAEMARTVSADRTRYVIEKPKK